MLERDAKHLVDLIAAAFPPVANGTMSLEDANQMDNYETTRDEFTGKSVEIDWRTVQDAYLEAFHWGLPYLDYRSWVGYLPAFRRYAITHVGHGDLLVTEALLSSLRPGSVHFADFETCSPKIQEIIQTVLAFLGTDYRSKAQASALQVIQERDDHLKNQVH